MQTLTLIISLVLLPLLLVRLLRWLAWVQQKEYRPDRLWQFVLSEEGVQELLRLLPRKTDFTRTGLKRPAMTARAAMTGFLSLILIGYTLTAAYSFSWWWLSVLAYLFLPIFPAATAVLTELGKSILSTGLLFAAQRKVAATKPTIIGVTGSYGKTTTRHLVAHVLSQQFTVYTPPRSHNTPISIAWNLLRNYRQQEFLVLEYAAYKKGEIKRLARWFKPLVSIVTGVTEQHLALFGSIEKIIEAKGELVKATKLDGQVFYNGSDERVIQICRQDTSKKAVPYAGLSSVVKIDKAKLNDKGRLQFAWQGKTIVTHLSVLYSTKAMQAAIAVGQYFKVPDKKIAAGLSSFLPTDNYIQVYPHKNQGYLIINDGKTSNPQGFLGALELLGHFKKQGKNTVLLTSGIIDLGDQSDEIHLKLAKAAAEVADLVLYAGVDGRHIFKEIFGNNLTGNLETIKTVMEKLNEKDVILLEGNVPKWLNQELQRNYD